MLYEYLHSYAIPLSYRLTKRWCFNYCRATVYLEFPDSINWAIVQSRSDVNSNRSWLGWVHSILLCTNKSIDSAYTSASIACVFVTGVKSSSSVRIQLFNHARIEHLHIYYSRRYVQRAKALQLVDHSLWYATLKDKRVLSPKGFYEIKKNCAQKILTWESIVVRSFVYASEKVCRMQTFPKWVLQCKNLRYENFWWSTYRSEVVILPLWTFKKRGLSTANLLF